MNKTLSIIFLLFALNFTYSQEKECNCINELENIATLIKNAKSYSQQIKKDQETTELKSWQEKIRQEIVNDSLSNYFCSGYLQKYISFIKDKHNQVYTIPDNISLNVPDYPKAIDTTLKGTDKISGIYHAGSDEIVLQNENDSIWFGVTLKSNSDAWTKGKIRLRLHKTKDGKFELFEFYSNGILFYQNNVKIENGRIYSTFWNKQNDYYFNKNFEDNFTFKSLNPSFNYIGIKTLSRTKDLIKEANTFYEDHLELLNKENLIIDLRNNGGGSTNQAKPLLKALKKNEQIKHIYVLINFKTASAAELVTLKLKEDKRTKILGENSRGMLEYGYGNRSFSAKTKCAEFNVVLSTKHTNKKLGKYESIGISPDIELNTKADWVEQIIEMAKK